MIHSIQQGELPGRVTTGLWTALDLAQPSVLQPTWSPRNPGAASVAILPVSTFIPTLFWVPDSAFGLINPGLAPQNQIATCFSHDGGRLVLPAGRVWVCNPNPSALPVPYALWGLGTNTTGALSLTTTGLGRALGRGSPLYDQGAINLPGLTGPGAVIALWDAFRVSLTATLYANAATAIITLASFDPIASGGFLLKSGAAGSGIATNFTSPMPWYYHEARSAGAAAIPNGMFIQEVTR